jgi:hypothetical protein
MKSQIQKFYKKVLRINLGKHFFLSLSLVMAGIGLFAQKGPDDKAMELLKSKKIQDAKTEIDRVVADPKNLKNPEVWYTKMKVYIAIAQDSSLRSTVPDAYSQSLDAFEKYADYDDKKIYLRLLQDKYAPMNEIYQGFFQTGATDYNSGKYDDALTHFKGAIDALSFMSLKGWATQKMDTTSTLYAGISAEKAKKRDVAAFYYKTIADSGITRIGTNDMLNIYLWLVDYYNGKKDEANTWKYIAIGKAKYPKELFWTSTELEILRKKPNKDSLWAEYDQILKEFPDNYLFYYNYGLEMYQYASDTSGGKHSNEDLIKRAQDNLTKSLQLKPDYPQAAMVLGQVSYNSGVDYQLQAKAIKGTKPEDVKKRADIRAQATKKFDEAIPYFEKVDQDLGSKGKLKMEEKTVLKDTYDLLITIYEQKNIKEKADAYTNKFNNVDKDH